MAAPLTDLSFPQAVWGAQGVSTLAFLGPIWFVQLVHYALFLDIDSRGFTAFAVTTLIAP